MKQIFLLAFVLCTLSAHAQFFFDFPPRRRVEQRREPYTAPVYKKGEEGMKAFIRKNFKQPKEREQVDGKVVVAALVNEKGNVAETQLVRSVSKNLDAEAIRVCRKMTFKPAKRGKKKVQGRVDIVFPIRNGRLSYLNLPAVEL